VEPRFVPSRKSPLYSLPPDLKAIADEKLRRAASEVPLNPVFVGREPGGGIDGAQRRAQPSVEHSAGAEGIGYRELAL